MEQLDFSSLIPPELWFQQVLRMLLEVAGWYAAIDRNFYNCLFLLQFVALDGLNSGVPTRTTATLTPTTLRNIEQTFIELQCEVEPHQNEAGFVPPVVQPVQQGRARSRADLITLVNRKICKGTIN